MSPRPKNRVAEFERRIAGAAKSQQHYELKLYITGTTARSATAITNIKMLCEKYLHGRYHLEVVDVYQQPGLAQGEQIIAAPTLVKKTPFPLRRIVGDLSNLKQVLIGLDIQKKDPDPSTKK